MDPNKLNSSKITAVRTRASILGHNEILWDIDGAIVKQGKGLVEFGLEHIDSESDPINYSKTARDSSALHDLWLSRLTVTNPAVVTPMSDTLARGTNGMETYSFQSVDLSQPYFDLDIFNSDISFLPFDQTAPDTHLGSFDGWLEGLPFPTEVNTPPSTL